MRELILDVKRFDFELKSSGNKKPRYQVMASTVSDNKIILVAKRRTWSAISYDDIFYQQYSYMSIDEVDNDVARSFLNQALDSIGKKNEVQK